MNLAPKLDRIAARAEELRDMLTHGLSGEAYVKASRELADIEPVVARRTTRSHCSPTPRCANWRKPNCGS